MNSGRGYTSIYIFWHSLCLSWMWWTNSRRCWLISRGKMRWPRSKRRRRRRESSEERTFFQESSQKYIANCRWSTPLYGLKLSNQASWIRVRNFHWWDTKYLANHYWVSGVVLRPTRLTFQYCTNQANIEFRLLTIRWHRYGHSGGRGAVFTNLNCIKVESRKISRP